MIVLLVVASFLLLTPSECETCYEYSWTSEKHHDHGCHNSPPICNGLTAGSNKRCGEVVKNCKCGKRCREFEASVDTKRLDTGTCMKETIKMATVITVRAKIRQCVTPKEEKDICSDHKRHWRQKYADVKASRKAALLENINCVMKE